MRKMYLKKVVPAVMLAGMLTAGVVAAPVLSSQQTVVSQKVSDASYDTTDQTAEEQVSDVTGKDTKKIKAKKNWKNYAKLLDLNDKKGENLIMSPLSLNLALGMAANGGSGKTLSEIEEFLKSDIASFNQYASQYSENNKVLKSANSLWVTNNENYKIATDYKELVEKFYGAGAENVDFADKNTVNLINDWISEKTNKLLPNVLDALDPELRLVLVNALYFKGQFDDIFEAEATNKQNFTNEDGSKKKVDMMHGNTYCYYENQKATGFEKTYENGKYSLITILPKKEGDFNFSDLKLASFLKSKQDKEVIISMPKFEYESSRQLNASLMQLGIVRAFDSENATLDKMFETGQTMYISDVIQAAKIKMDEKGTEAAAATIIMARDNCLLAPELPKQVVLDRPFGYIIMDNKTRTPLFMGKVVNLK